MKLYTYCDPKQSEIKIKNSGGCKKQEYSYSDYLRFIDEVKKYYIKMYHSWYETDMSDSDSGSKTNYFTVNYNNMIIKDGKLYGTLVSTDGMFPKYYIFPLDQEKCAVELEGGYNSNAYEWTYESTKDCVGDSISCAFGYVLTDENILYSDDNKNIKFYTREVVNFLPENVIFDASDRAIGFRYSGFNVLFSDPKKTVNENHVLTLHKIDENFLDRNVINVYYDDFKNGNFFVV